MTSAEYEATPGGAGAVPFDVPPEAPDGGGDVASGLVGAGCLRIHWGVRPLVVERAFYNNERVLAPQDQSAL